MKTDNNTTPLNFRRPRQLTFFYIVSLYPCTYQELQHRGCTYDVTLRLSYGTIVEAEKQEMLHIMNVSLSRLSYPACNAHAPYCYLWPVRPYYIFHIISQTERFKKYIYIYIVESKSLF